MQTPDLIQLVISIVLVFTFIANAVVAVMTYLMFRRQKREDERAEVFRKQTLTFELVVKREFSEEFSHQGNIFSHYRQSGTILKLAAPSNQREIADRKAVIDFLNHYELVAMGIRKAFLDPEVYKNWMRSTLIRDWQAAREFVQRERWCRTEGEDENSAWRYNSSSFEHFEAVAADWGGERLKLSETDDPRPPFKNT